MHFRVIATVSLLVFSPFFVSAQSFGGMGDTSSFSISVSPQYPRPQSSVVLSFVSAMIDLTNATMTVSSSGKQLYQGSVQPIAVPTGKAGSVTLVTVTIVSNGARFNQTVALQPEDVALVPEPLASAPLLYQGKPLTPLEGNTRVVAIPNFADATGRTIDPSTLSYSWNVDGAQIYNSSGIGKNTIIVASPIQYRSRDVSVLVQSQAGALVGQASLSLVPQDPVVRLYENDPLLGIRFEHALGDTYTIVGTEASIYGTSFSLPLINGTPLLQWFLNGTKAQTSSLITLRPAGSGKGNATLSLTATVGPDSLTTAGASLSVLFGIKSNTNFFGL
jgi:hypothetical protein